MEIVRTRCCCFTGHRPSKLTLPEEKLKALLLSEIRAAISDGYTAFISGMARGVDIIAAEAVLEMQRQYPDIALVCANPFQDSEDGFSEDWRARARRVEAGAALIINVCPKYFAGCYQKRNKWMIANSSRLIAIFNGTPGGTQNTIVYAQSESLDVRIILIPQQLPPHDII